MSNYYYVQIFKYPVVQTFLCQESKVPRCPGVQKPYLPSMKKILNTLHWDREPGKMVWIRWLPHRVGKSGNNRNNVSWNIIFQVIFQVLEEKQFGWKKILKITKIYNLFMYFFTLIYRGSFDHEKVIAKPFFLTKTLIVFVCDMPVNFWKLFLKDIAKTVLLRPVGGL